MKKVCALLVSIMMMMLLASCAGNENSKESSTDTTGSSESQSESQNQDDNSDDNTDEGNNGGNNTADGLPTIDALTLGEDYTDLTANIEFKTHRTDILDIFEGYVEDFQKMYPNITITYEAITDYAETMVTRLSTPQWGDVCMIPTSIPVTELENYFAPLGNTATLEETYNFADNRMYNGISYGLSSTNNAQGVLYNKRIYEEAGISELPKTPEEFLDALQQIKDNTDAVPLYTNFAAGWTMGAWDAYIAGTATGDPDFMNVKLAHMKDPFSDWGDGTGPYAVYNVLYESVVRGLVEDDPATSDWEASKVMLNNGEVATMVLGSWAIVQMEEAGPNPQDIGYMSFPISVNGKQYAGAGADYCYGVNVNSSDDNKIAAMLYIKYLIEESNFDYEQGGIPTLKTNPLPPTLEAFDGVELVSDNPAPAGEEDLLSDIRVESEITINMGNDHVIAIVEAALVGNKNMEDIAEDWNTRWAAAQEKYEVEPVER